MAVSTGTVSLGVIVSLGVTVTAVASTRFGGGSWRGRRERDHRCRWPGCGLGNHDQCERHDPHHRECERDRCGTAAQGTSPPNRLLDVAQGQVRGCHGDQHSGDVQPRAAEMHPVRRHQQEHGPVPEVQAIAAITDPPQRRLPKKPLPQSIGSGDDDNRQRNREQRKAPAEQPGRVVFSTHHDCYSNHQRGRCQPPSGAAAAQRAIRSLPGERSGGGTDQQSVRTRRRVHVGAGRRQRVEPDHHERDRRRRAGESQQPDRATVVRTAAGEQPDDRGPNEVVLLLDRERPEVAQRRRVGEACPVVAAAGDGAPVGGPRQ